MCVKIEWGMSLLMQSNVATTPFPKPAWLKDGLTIAGGNWEPLIFRRRTGMARSNEEEIFAAEHAPDMIPRLTELGVNLIILHFHKGYGLTAEAAEIEQARELTTLCHQHGIRAAAYIRWDNVVPETMRRDHPDIDQWLRRTRFGDTQSVFQSHRKAVCANCPEYLDYVERVVTLAIADIGFDMIHFDGFRPNEPCYCERCQADFRRYVREKYSEGEAFERFGHNQLACLDIPQWNDATWQHYLGGDAMESWNPDLIDPSFQEWHLYWESMTDRIHRRMRSLIKTLNPDAAIEINKSCPEFIGDDIDYWNHTDAFWDENFTLSLNADNGIFVTRVRTFKIGRQLGAVPFTYLRGDTERKCLQNLSEAMAFNFPSTVNLGNVYPFERAGRPDSPLPNITERLKRYLDFFHAHPELYREPEVAAEVLVWRQRNSRQFSRERGFAAPWLVEQAFIEARLPFTIGFDQALQPRCLDHYPVVVLPNTLLLSEGEVQVLCSYVKAGGALVTIGEDCGRYDEWFRSRPENVLSAIYGTGFDPARNTTCIRGAGRAHHVARLVPGPDYNPYGNVFQPGPMYLNGFFCAPKNSDELVAAVCDVRDTPLSFAVEAPRYVLAEYATAPGRRLVHLVNAADAPVGNISISLYVPGPDRDVLVRLRNPECEAVEWNVACKDNRVEVKLETLDVYTLVELHE